VGRFRASAGHFPRSGTQFALTPTDEGRRTPIENLKRWKRAVVHIESATNSVPPSVEFQAFVEASRALKAGEIDQNAFVAEQISRPRRDLRFHGTGLFVAHGDRDFLVTARHVVHDEHAAEDARREAAADRASYSRRTGHQLPEPNEDLPGLLIRQFLCRVPSLDEVTREGPGRIRESLMAMGEGWGDGYFTFSEPELDLAVISLARPYQGGEFADGLRRAGYLPVDVADFADEPTSEGAAVFTIGYPSAMALVDELRLDEAQKLWGSSFVSLPSTAFGRVSMLHPSLGYFWADLPIYPGNSGGPVVEGDRLVGLVSSQPVVPDPVIYEGKDLALTAITRVPFARVTKGKHVRALVDTQFQKDLRREESRRNGPRWSRTTLTE
jgi:hypothetical protein